MSIGRKVLRYQIWNIMLSIISVTAILEVCWLNNSKIKFILRKVKDSKSPSLLLSLFDLDVTFTELDPKTQLT